MSYKILIHMRILFYLSALNNIISLILKLKKTLEIFSIVFRLQAVCRIGLRCAQSGYRADRERAVGRRGPVY